MVSSLVILDLDANGLSQLSSTADVSQLPNSSLLRVAPGTASCWCTELESLESLDAREVGKISLVLDVMGLSARCAEFRNEDRGVSEEAEYDGELGSKIDPKNFGEAGVSDARWTEMERLLIVRTGGWYR